MESTAALANRLLGEALRLARYGLKVFPCVPAQKVPQIKDNLRLATTDESRIREWWAKYPCANIGIATGESNLVVIDVDEKNGGDVTFAEIIKRVGAAQFETVTALTPSGGQHLIYAAGTFQVRTGVHVLGQGIDIRALGGYCVFTPSEFNGVSYRWQAGCSPYELTPLPWSETLNSLIVKKPRRIITEGEPIALGGRNDTFASLAGTMRRRGFSFEGISAALMAENTIPGRDPLPEAEVLSIAKSIAAYPPNVDEAGGIEWEDASPWPMLGSDSFSGLPGDLVRTLEPHTEADPGALLITILTMFGNAAALADGSSAFVRRGATRHPPRLFALVSGATAKSRKGQSYSEVCQLFAQADAEYLEAAQISGLSSGEGLIHHLRDRKDEESPVEKRALVHESEFSRVLTAVARKECTLSAILRDTWDVKPLRVLTRKDPLVAKNAYVSILAHITTEELLSRVSDVDITNGLLNRLLILAARRSKTLPSGGHLKLDDIIKMGHRVKLMLARARRTKEVVLSPAAEELWDRLYCNCFPEESGLVGSILARGEAHTLRLALIYALMDEDKHAFDGGEFTIDPRHIEAAYALWQYVDASTRHIFGKRFGNDTADRLLRALRENYPEGLDFTQQRDVFGRHASESRLSDARNILESRKFIHTISLATGGRRRHVSYAIHPAERRDESDKSDEVA